jgi:hypothetical protein
LPPPPDTKIYTSGCDGVVDEDADFFSYSADSNDELKRMFTMLYDR